MTKQKQWKTVVEKFHKDYDELHTLATKYEMNGEISTVALEVYMGYVLNNTCVHTLQKLINQCYNEVINDQINNLKKEKTFKVGRNN